MVPGLYIQPGFAILRAESSRKMNSNTRNWTLVRLQAGERRQFWPLAEGATRLGRDQANQIHLADTSVSRRHAEITCGPEGVTICDLKSRNGVQVNGVPRQRATLQAGDRVRIGIFELELAAAPPSSLAPPAGEAESGPQAQLSATIEQGAKLPESARELYALYHICFWITEGLDEKEFAPKCLKVLLDVFRAVEAQFYSAEGRLEAFAGQEKEKPVIKLASFLAKRFQESPEAINIPGSSIARHQQKVGQFNYLVAPLRAGQSPKGESPFVVLLRPAEWTDYTGSDRVLLQAICQLWVRGQAKVMQMNDLRQENALLKNKVSTPVLLGGSAEIEALRVRARKAAATNLTMLLRGESGSGKEVVAQFIHENSGQRNGPFIKVNCAAIPETLIESELFGHMKGAFTDARGDRKGKFTQADNGTLFLDEIGDMPVSVQAKVLRAIENGEIEPVGAEAVVRVKVRIIAATNRDLAEMARKKEFREDLFYRLNVMPIRVPPLREHLDDLEVLAGHFLQKFCAENGQAEMCFAPEAIAELKKHTWPGNVRELRNMVQRCAVNSEPPVIAALEVREQIQHSL